jgi:hypothetical protein
MKVRSLSSLAGRAGATGILKEAICEKSPSPDALCASTSPRKRGEVDQISAGIDSIKNHSVLAELKILRT